MGSIPLLVYPPPVYFYPPIIALRSVFLRHGTRPALPPTDPTPHGRMILPPLFVCADLVIFFFWCLFSHADALVVAARQICTLEHTSNGPATTACPASSISCAVTMVVLFVSFVGRGTPSVFASCMAPRHHFFFLAYVFIFFVIF